MAKFEDIFAQSNTQYPVVISGMPQAPQDTQYGPKYKVQVTKDGASYDWFMKPEQFDRNFTDGMGNVLYNVGDEILVTKVKDPKYKWPFYAVDAGQKGVGPSAPVRPYNDRNNVTVSDDGQPHAEAKQYQISAAGVYQAYISTGMEPEKAKALVEEDVRWLKRLGMKMAMDDQKAVNDVEEAFSEPETPAT